MAMTASPSRSSTRTARKKVIVSPDTPIVNFVDGAKSELTAGAKDHCIRRETERRHTSSKRVLVGRDGITPPM